MAVRSQAVAPVEIAESKRDAPAEDVASEKAPAFANPYPGPQPFSAVEANLFFGRDRESRDLLSLTKAHGEILLYAQSGAGKTSLLKAGLIPLLVHNGFRVMPPARVVGPLNEIRFDELDNVFVFHVLSAWAEPPVAPRTLAKLTIPEFLEARQRESGGDPRTNPCVLVLDQLEEMFSSYNDQWKKREDFFRQLGEALSQNPQLRMIAAMREDFIAELASYTSFLPEQFKTRYRLQCLRQPAALLAVRGPLAAAGSKRVFAPGVAQKLVEDLSRTVALNPEGRCVEFPGEFVEPFQLQVVCQNLWDTLPADVVEITEQHLADFGNINTALIKFYESCLARVMKECPGVREGMLRRWCARVLITRNGTRNIVLSGATETAHLRSEAVKVLEDARLLRKEERSGAAWHELVHDQFIPAIRRSNELWLLRHGGALQIRRRLQQRARAWVLGDRAAGKLLDAVDLREAERWLGSAEAEELGLGSSAMLKQFVRASRVELARKVEAQRARARLALSRELAAAAVANVEIDPELAVLLALEAGSKISTPEADEALRRAILACRTVQILPHEAPVFGVSFSPGGDLLATAGADCKCTLWDWRTRQIVARLAGHSAPVLGLSFSPSGRMLATGSLDGTIRLWNVAGGEALHVLTGHEKPVVGVAFSQDGKLVASGSFDQTAKIWDVQSGALLRTFGGHSACVIGVAFGPKGRRLATASMDRTARIFTVADGAEIRRFSGHDGAVYSVAFSPDGRKIATSSLDQTARLWEAASGRLLMTYKEHTAMLGLVTFNPAGTRIATASADGTAKVWDVPSGCCLATLRGHKGLVFGVSYGPDGQHLATASPDKTVRIWVRSTGLNLTGHTDEIKHVAFSADGQRVATASVDGSARVWKAATGIELHVLKGHRALVYDVAFSPTGEYLATGGIDNTARIWSETSGRSIATLRHAGPVFGVAFAPSGKLLATGCGDNSVQIWEIPSGKKLHTLEGHSDLVYTSVFSPDGSRLLTCGADATARIWDFASRTEVLLVSGHVGIVYDASWSPDGRRFATAGSDSNAKIWDASSGRELFVLAEHMSSVNGVTFSRDGARLASGSSDRTAKIWDAASGACLFTLPGHTGIVNSVAFSPDGRWLATAGANKFVNLHLLDINELRAMAKQRSLREFTPEERKKYLKTELEQGAVSRP